jgi:hypothetical protein
MFTAIDSNALQAVTGGAGAGYNTGITGGIKGINNKVPRPHSQGKGWNTGITGGIPGINNKVPRPSSHGHNTGITGGIPGINNKVPWFDF